MVFKKAKKEQAKLRLALSGPSGSGKTYTALTFAKYIGKKVAVIDTEGNSASKYANLFDFDVVSLEDCHPRNFIQAIDEACRYGYDVLIIDSLSHAYSGKNGLLELTDKEKLRLRTNNNFQAWGKTSPLQTEFINKILTSHIHIIATLRVKTAYDMVDENGKKKPVKIGLEPIQKPGVEYEFDILGEMTPDNTFIVSKTRCPELNGYIKQQPGAETAEIIKKWLSDGVAPDPQQEEAPAQQSAPAPAVKESKKIIFPTSVKADKAEAEQNKAKEDLAKKGIFEDVGVLEKIAEKQESSGTVYGYIISGQPVGFRSYSSRAAEENKKLIGQKVLFKALVGPNGCNLISIQGA